jgi:hypothetical protein
LHSREHEASAFLYGFDLLAMDGMDLLRERLDDRCAKLGQLLAMPPTARSSFGTPASSGSKASSASAATRRIVPVGPRHGPKGENPNSPAVTAR